MSVNDSDPGLAADDSIERTTLLDALDKAVMVVLCDDQVLIGKLRSVDQFNSVVLHETVERVLVGMYFADIPRGILLVRGENIQMLGEYDHQRAQHVGLMEVGVETIRELRGDIEEEIRMKADARRRFFRSRGLPFFSERERFQMEDY